MKRDPANRSGMSSSVSTISASEVTSVRARGSVRLCGKGAEKMREIVKLAAKHQCAAANVIETTEIGMKHQSDQGKIRTSGRRRGIRPVPVSVVLSAGNGECGNCGTVKMH